MTQLCTGLLRLARVCTGGGTAAGFDQKHLVFECKAVAATRIPYADLIGFRLNSKS